MFGGTPATPAYNEIISEYGQANASFYANFISLFLCDIDRENGSLIRLPYAGSGLEQPAGEHEAYKILQGVYFQKIAADIESQKSRGR